MKITSNEIFLAYCFYTLIFAIFMVPIIKFAIKISITIRKWSGESLESLKADPPELVKGLRMLDLTSRCVISLPIFNLVALSFIIFTPLFDLIKLLLNKIKLPSIDLDKIVYRIDYNEMVEKTQKTDLLTPSESPSLSKELLRSK